MRSLAPVTVYVLLEACAIGSRADGSRRDSPLSRLHDNPNRSFSLINILDLATINGIDDSLQIRNTTDQESL